MSGNVWLIVWIIYDGGISYVCVGGSGWVDGIVIFVLFLYFLVIVFEYNWFSNLDWLWWLILLVLLGNLWYFL